MILQTLTYFINKVSFGSDECPEPRRRVGARIR